MIIESYMSIIKEFVLKLGISNCIALLGVLVTALFSFVLWWTTRQIGKRQNEIQERQYKIELNKVYRSLYGLFSEIEKVCNAFFYNIETGVLATVDETERNLFRRDIEKIDDIQNKLTQSEVDIKLQLPDYQLLVYEADILLVIIRTVYFSIQNLQIPFEKRHADDKTLDMIRRVIATINNDGRGNDLLQNVDIESVTNEQYVLVLYEIRKVLGESSWEIENYVKRSDDEKINYIKGRLAILDESINIEKDCKNFVYYRNRIFVKANILEAIKKKCELQ